MTEMFTAYWPGSQPSPFSTAPLTGSGHLTVMKSMLMTLMARRLGLGQLLLLSYFKVSS